MATSEKPGETGRTFHSVCRELLVGLTWRKMGVNIPCVEKFDPSSEPSVVVDEKETDRKRGLKYISDCLGKRAWGMQKGSVNASLWRSGTAGRIFGPNL